jgi:SAM-dependent methyltransferase
MLHHVPSAELQDRLLAEVCRVLRPGGLLVGTDSSGSDELAEFHAGDVYVPISPATMPARLEAAGFIDVAVDEVEGRFRFRGHA